MRHAADGVDPRFLQLQLRETVGGQMILKRQCGLYNPSGNERRSKAPTLSYTIPYIFPYPYILFCTLYDIVLI
jgi:hypothetical protein